MTQRDEPMSAKALAPMVCPASCALQGGTAEWQGTKRREKRTPNDSKQQATGRPGTHFYPSIAALRLWPREARPQFTLGRPGANSCVEFTSARETGLSAVRLLCNVLVHPPHEHSTYAQRARKQSCRECVIENVLLWLSLLWGSHTQTQLGCATKLWAGRGGAHIAWCSRELAFSTLAAWPGRTGGGGGWPALMDGFCSGPPPPVERQPF